MNKKDTLRSITFETSEIKTLSLRTMPFETSEKRNRICDSFLFQLVFISFSK